MRLREWVNNNSVIATSLAVVLLAVALSVVALQLRGPDRTRQVYFWDLEAGEEFVLSNDNIPPVEAPSGGRGVRAHFYTCGECTPDEWFGYLETFSEEAKRLQEQGELVPAESREHLVRPLNGDQWVSYFSDQGMMVQDAVFTNDCGDGQTLPKECTP